VQGIHHDNVYHRIERVTHHLEVVGENGSMKNIVRITYGLVYILLCCLVPVRTRTLYGFFSSNRQKKAYYYNDKNKDIEII